MPVNFSGKQPCRTDITEKTEGYSKLTSTCVADERVIGRPSVLDVCIDELRSIVVIYPTDGEWNGRLCGVDRINPESLPRARECGTDGPPGRDIGHREGVNVSAACVVAAIGQ